MSASDPAQELRDAGAVRAASFAKYRQDHARVLALIPAAYDADVPITDIAEYAGVSRVTVYSILEAHAKRA